jgi:hypothetical protein
MSGKVVFYALSRKFLERESDMPETARQVIYQTLALGHHIGVIDCLKTVLECPLDGYEAWIGRLAEGDARSKLQGVGTFGEIMIDSTHTHMLALALDRAQADFSEQEKQWAAQLMASLSAIELEPAMYLMVRRRDN